MADFAFNPPKHTVEVHIGKDVLSKGNHTPELAQRQADRLIAAGHKVRGWSDKKLVRESHPST